MWLLDQTEVLIRKQGTGCLSSDGQNPPKGSPGAEKDQCLKELKMQFEGKIILFHACLLQNPDYSVNQLLNFIFGGVPANTKWTFPSSFALNHQYLPEHLFQEKLLWKPTIICLYSVFIMWAGLNLRMPMDKDG